MAARRAAPASLTESGPGVRAGVADGLVAGLGSCDGAAAPTAQAVIATASTPATLAPTPIATPVAPTPTPTPTAKPRPPAVLKLGSIATVVSDGLRVRSRPEVSDDSKKLEPLLQRGDHVFVVKGPVAGSGYRWYEVQPLGDPGDQERPWPVWLGGGRRQDR